MYARAIADPRPGSIAWATADNNIGSVSVSHALSNSMSSMGASSVSMGSTRSRKKLFTDFDRPAALLPIGEKRNLFHVSRVGDNHFTFSQGGVTLDPGHGVIRDRDTVERVAEKLHKLYPDELPTVVFMGDASLPGTLPTRTVKTVFGSHGLALAAKDPIGPQCLKTDFKKYWSHHRTLSIGSHAQGQREGTA